MRAVIVMAVAMLAIASVALASEVEEVSFLEVATTTQAGVSHQLRVALTA